MNEVERALELLRALAVDDPCTSSLEGLSDACFWCGGDAYGKRSPETGQWEHGATHDAECSWVAARRYLGRSLGAGNPVRSKDNRGNPGPSSGPTEATK